MNIETNSSPYDFLRLLFRASVSVLISVPRQEDAAPVLHWIAESFPHFQTIKFQDLRLGESAESVDHARVLVIEGGGLIGARQSLHDKIKTSWPHGEQYPSEVSAWIADTFPIILQGAASSEGLFKITQKFLAQRGPSESQLCYQDIYIVKDGTWKAVGFVPLIPLPIPRNLFSSLRL